MKIDEKMIFDIFDLKIKIKDKDKIKLSKYQELIPMYDIYSQQIYPIKKENIHYRLIESHYRFINQEIYDWLKNLYEKYKSNKEIASKFEKNLKIIENYDIPTLIETSKKTLFDYSLNFGLKISICKRNSFNPFMKHLKPYYSKPELIKLSKNMQLKTEKINNIKTEDINNIKLIDKETHYKFCKLVSSNDISYEEIKNHTQQIVDNKIISWICFYSFIGSFILNNILRKNLQISSFLYEGLSKITNFKSDELKNNYYIYRFSWDDNFIKNLNIGDIFVDNGFMSTTRDPFYSPGINSNGKFGLVLLKIHLPKNTKGIGLFIENFSLFPNEQEFLLNPYSKLKLISKNENFKYYHTNKEFEKLINIKYEFEYIGCDYNFIKNIKINNNIKKIEDLSQYESRGDTRIMIIKNFVENYQTIDITFKSKLYQFQCSWFDSSESSSYSKLYYNKMLDGMMFSLYKNGYPYLNIEIGNEMVINYLNRFYFYNDESQDIDKDIIELLNEIARIFYYKVIIISHQYKNFHEFSKDNIYAYNRMYNHSIYNYAKNKVKFLYEYNYQYSSGWYKLDKFLNIKLSDTLINKYKIPNNNNTIREALIYIIENNFILYDNFVQDLDDFTYDILGLDDSVTLNKNDYVVYDTFKNQSNDYIDKLNKISLNNQINNDDYTLVFTKQVFRRL